MTSPEPAHILSKFPFIGRVHHYLQSIHGCHTIVLYGSYARGDQNSESDLDALGVSDSATEEFRVADAWPIDEDHDPKSDHKSERQFCDLDVFVHPRHQLETLSCAELQKLRWGVILTDPFGIAQKNIQRVQEWVKTPPKMPSDWHRAQTLSWCKRMVRRACQCDTEGHYRLHWLAMEVLPIWFELRGQHFFGPKESFAWLKKHEPKTFDQFDAAMRPGASPLLLLQIVNEI